MAGKHLNYHGGKVNMYSRNNTQSLNFSDFLWQQLHREIKRRVDPVTFNSWFSNLQFIGINKNKLELGVASKFIKEWITNNYTGLILKVASRLKPEITVLEIKVKTTRNRKGNIKNLTDLMPSSSSPDEPANMIGSRLNGSFNFENFVVGNFNEIAYGAAQRLLNTDGKMPGEKMLYVVGKFGVGKTHIIQALATRATQMGHKAIYFTAEKFMNQYVNAYQTNSLNAFREFIMANDIFIIDDLQFICGKNSTQQELMRIVTNLIEHGKCIVASADTSPFTLKLERRFTSRLIGGMVTEIGTPDYETRLQIINKKLSLLNETLSDGIAEFIADNITSSVRELEGAMFKVISHRSILNTQITLDQVKKILSDNIAASQNVVNFETILSAVANYFDVSSESIISKSRLQKYVYPRQVVAMLAKQLTKDSLQEIGENLGGRDHATVIYSISKLESRLQADEKLRNDIAKLITTICG